MADAEATAPIPWTRHVVARPRDTLSGYFVPPEAWPELADAAGARRLTDLFDVPVVVLLGEPGMGRTTALGDLARRWGARVIAGQSVRDARVLALSVTPPPAPDGDAAARSILVDDIERVGEDLVPTLRALVGQLAPDAHRPRRLWLSARADAWSDEATEILKRLTGPDTAPTVVHLAGLTGDDVRLAAAEFDLDPDALLERLDRTHGVGLARNPATLMPLLARVRRDGRVPPGRAALFDAMSRAACGDDPDSMSAAGRLAAFMVFGGHEAVGPAAALGVDRIGAERARVGRVLSETGLLVEQAPGEWVWRAPSVAMYLAAWSARQHRPDAAGVRALFGHPGGQGSDRLEECAAFAMDLLDGPARAALVALYPAAELKSDLHLRPAADRLAAARRLLDRCAQGGTDTRDELDKLAAPGLAALLRPYIEDPSRDRIARRQAIRIVRACAITELVEPLLEMALDPHDDYGLRRYGAVAAGELGTDTQVEQMRALLDRPLREDPLDELLGTTLRALWRRGSMTAAQMLPYLRRPQRSTMGTTYTFLIHELGGSAPQWLDGPALHAVLEWYRGCDSSGLRDAVFVPYDPDRRSNLWQAVIKHAASRLDEPGIRDGLIQWLAGLGEFSDADPFRLAVEGRPELLPSFLALCAEAGRSPKEILYLDSAPPVSASAVLDMIEAIPRPERLEWLSELVDLLPKSESDLDRLCALYIDEPDTFGRFQLLHHCPVDGPEADSMRADHQQHVEWEVQHAARREQWRKRREEREAAEQARIVREPMKWLIEALEKVEAARRARRRRRRHLIQVPGTLSAPCLAPQPAAVSGLLDTVPRRWYSPPPNVFWSGLVTQPESRESARHASGAAQSVRPATPSCVGAVGTTTYRSHTHPPPTTRQTAVSANDGTPTSSSRRSAMAGSARCTRHSSPLSCSRPG